MKDLRHKVSALAMVAALAVGASGCTTLSAVTSGQTVTPQMVENDAVSLCGYLPSAETASNLIQAATQTAGSGTATTDAALTTLAEQLAGLACTVAKNSATTSTTTTPTPAGAKVLRALRRRGLSVSIAPGVAYVGNVPVAVSGSVVNPTLFAQ